MQKHSLLKVLTQADIGSRRKITAAIKEGRVSVNGCVVTGFNYLIDLGKDHILLDSRLVNIKQQQYLYLMLHKPKGVFSTVSDEHGRQTVIDLLPIKYRHRRLYPVGRLDKDSSGLVLLTNDGDLTYRITHPRFEYEKEYEVLVKGELKAGEIRRMEMGIKLEENKTSPAVVKKIKSNDCNYGITIREGRKHQVKRMFEAIGHPVLELRRVRMGNLKLGKLKKGGVREVGKIEL
jgi:23S rRNA pseudouridine2605 synthase